MVDPSKISNFNLNNDELEEVLLFWVCAAGKNGKTTARLLGNFLSWLHIGYPEESSPFAIIKKMDEEGNLVITKKDWLESSLKSHGIGNYTLRARCFRQLISANLNLKTCTIRELDDIIGIGPKTARAFVTHSRPGQRFAIIDTHILKYLAHLGYKVPKSTPTTKRYNELEKVYLNICDEHSVEPYELDLAVWNHYSNRPKEHFDIEQWKETK
jgi:hypothetical protein